MKQTWYKGPEVEVLLAENVKLKEQYVLLASQMDSMKAEFSALVEALRADLEGLRKDTDAQLTDLEDSLWADHRRLKERLDALGQPKTQPLSSKEGAPKKLGCASPPCFGHRWKSLDTGCVACPKRIPCKEACTEKRKLKTKG